MKTAKFLLCENPIAQKSDGRLFILHNRKPIILAEVHHYEGLSEEKRMEIERGLTAGARLDYHPETIYFVPIWIQEEKDSKLDAQKSADQIAGTLRRMADWYKSYLIWEHSQ